MIFETVEEFFSHVGTDKVLCLDVGESNIGIAVGNAVQAIASPVDTIRREKLVSDIEELRIFISDYAAAGLVIGLPLNMDGTEGRKCQAVRQFARDVLKTFDIPIFFWDERFSTYAAEQMMSGMGVKYKKIQEVNDKIAASHILQSFLELAQQQLG